MPIVRFLSRVVRVPDTWEAWAMRVLTIGIVVSLATSWMLMGRVAELSDQISRGRGERNTFQEDQTARTCAVLRVQGVNATTLRDAKC